MKTKYKFGTILLIFFLFGSILGYTLAQSGNTFIISEGIYPNAPTYTIWREGSTYYVKNSYGLQPTFSGVTNASTLINNVLSAMESTGGKLYFKNAEYLLDIYLRVGTGLGVEGLHIEGESKEVIFKASPTFEDYAPNDYSGGSNTYPMMYVYNQTNIKLSNFQIQPDIINNNNYTMIGIAFLRVNGMEVNDVLFYDEAVNGFAFNSLYSVATGSPQYSDQRNILVTNCELLTPNANYGSNLLQMNWGENIIVSNNVKDGYDTLFYGANVQNVVVSNNVLLGRSVLVDIVGGSLAYPSRKILIEGNVQSGIGGTQWHSFGGASVRIWTSANDKYIEDVTIANNLFEGDSAYKPEYVIHILEHSSYSPVWIRNVQIIGNIINATFVNSHAIYVDVSQTGSKGMLISENTIYNANYTGVYLRGVENGTISNNKVRDTGQYASATFRSGIFLENVTNSLIIGNTASDEQSTATQQYGLREYGATTDYNLFIGNMAFGNVVSGITVLGTNTRVANSWNGTTYIRFYNSTTLITG